MILPAAILNDVVLITVLAIGINRTVPDTVLLFDTLYANVRHFHT